MTFPWPLVTSSTWASAAHNRKMAKPTATETMISRAPVRGSRRRLVAGAWKGSVAIVRAYSLSRRQNDRCGRFRGLGLMVGDRLGSRAAIRGHRNVEGPALGRIEQSADIVVGAGNWRSGERRIHGNDGAVSQDRLPKRRPKR